MPAVAAHADPSPASLQQQINQSNAKMDQLVEQYNQITEQLAGTRAQADQLNAQMAPLQSHLDDAYGNVGKIAVTAYKGLQVSAFNALLNAGSPTAFVDGLSTLNQLASDQQRQITGYHQAKADFDARRTQLETLLAQQTAQQADLAAQKAQIQSDVAKLLELRKRAFGRATEAAPTRPSGPPPPVSGRAGAVVAFAYRAIGVRYVFAGASMSGMDCSGLVMLAYQQIGVHFGHGVRDQWAATRRVPMGSQMPGDVVFYSGLGHDGIYVGNNQVIDAPHTGAFVNLRSVNIMPIAGFGRP